MLAVCFHHREARPNLVSFGGVVKGESAMKMEEEIGSSITYTFKVGFTQQGNIQLTRRMYACTCQNRRINYD